MRIINRHSFLSKLHQIIFKGLPSTKEEQVLEYNQTINRFYNLLIISFYVIIASVATSPDNKIEKWAIVILTYYTIYTPIALFHMYLVKKYPGHYLVRRIFIMLLDLGSLCFSIAVHWSTMLPLFAVIVWVTLGNGLRFGPRYLILAVVISQIGLLVAYVFTPLLWEYQAVAIALSVTALTIPLYARSLIEDVRRAKLEAEEASLAKSRFLAQASHDLRQPIHAIGLFLNRLKDSKLRADQEIIVGRIDRSLEGVADLFRSLLDVSTLDSGAIDPKFEPVAVAQVFADLEQQNQSAADWAGASLRFMPSRAIIHTDRTLLTTVLQNLVSNAIKYAPGQSILIGCRRTKTGLSIWVSDTGEGIAAEHLPHLFDEFYQAKSIGDADKAGVGLGLSIVKRLVALLGLEVTINSVPGSGTTVIISGLQMCEGADADLRAVQTTNYARPLRGVRIVLIEDDRDVLDATAELLRSWGCKVQIFAGMPSHPQPCDIIISDFDIGGGVTGADCIAAVRQFAEKHIPAIVMTGHDETNVGNLLSDSSIPILKKPVRPAELRSLIGSLRVQASGKSGVSEATGSAPAP